MSPVQPANTLTIIRAVTNLFRHSFFFPWLQSHCSEVGSWLLRKKGSLLLIRVYIFLLLIREKWLKPITEALIIGCLLLLGLLIAYY